MINNIDLALMLLKMILDQAKVGGAVVEGIEDVQSAFDFLMKVRSSPVTFGQLEGLRFKPQW